MNDLESMQSVLFVRFSGNARLHEKLGALEAQRAVDRGLKRIERAVDVFGGQIVKSDDSVLIAIFDTANLALQASTLMQQRIADLPPVSGIVFKICVGFSHGLVCQESEGFVGEALNTAEYLAEQALPGQVLLSAQAQTALSHALSKTTCELASSPRGNICPEIKIFALVTPTIPAHESKSPDIPLPSSDGHQSVNSQKTRLCLRYADKIIILDDKNRIIHLGRDQESDVIIRDCHASRKHARIEWREDSPVLIDSSTNGTFLTLREQQTLFLHGGEHPLSGKGLICFAAPTGSPGVDCVEFELLGKLGGVLKR